MSAGFEPRRNPSGPRATSAAVRGGRRALLALLAVGAVAALAAAPASAHPLGNFTTNQLLKVSVDQRRANLDYVLDLAEIPSFQLRRRFDGDGDGAIGGAERGPLIAELEAELEAGLALSADGRPLELQPSGEPRLSFPAGQAGLSLTRFEAAYAAKLDSPRTALEVSNEAFADRTGWRAIQALPGEGADVVSSVAADDPTDGLRTYPQGVLESPPDERAATFEVSPGTGRLQAPDATGGAEQTADRAGDGFAATLTGADTGGVLILVLFASAFGWGALHALSPGHGKAMVAGYLAGSRGTARHALALGATVTATHTASVFALGLLTLAASEYILPEDLYPWLGVASGLIVVGVGLVVMRTRYRRWRATRSGAPLPHSHDHDHGHSHGHGHDHGHGDAPIRMRELLGLGVSGGVVPCPSALVVLIAAISQHRVGLGIALILAFSVGLAATISGVGLLTIHGQRLLARLEVERRLFGGRLTGALPAISATVIVLVGVLITSRALPELG